MSRGSSSSGPRQILPYDVPVIPNGSLREVLSRGPTLVVDLRGTGSDRPLAEAGLQSALRLYGHQLAEVALIVTDDVAVGWSHG